MTTAEPTNPLRSPDSEDPIAAGGRKGVNESMTGMHFGLMLGVIALTGVVIRAFYIEQFAPSQYIFPDSSWYYAQARNLRLGHGYIDIARQLGAFNGHPEIAGFVGKGPQN